MSTVLTTAELTNSVGQFAVNLINSKFKAVQFELLFHHKGNLTRR